MQQHFAIAGSGFYLPRRKLTAEDIDRRAGLAAGWTRANTGVLVRYECEEPESLASMAQEAIASAMHEAAVGWTDVDLLLDASTSRHQPIPCNAACLQSCIGPPAHGIPGMDIQSTCLGFILAVHVANALFATGSYRHILIVCSEAALMAVDWQQPESACLMGDGSAAVVLRRAEPTPTYFFAHETFAQYLEACQMPGGAHRLPPNLFTPENEAEFRFHMDGSRLLRAASKHLPPLTRALLQDAGLTPEALHVMPHQASPRALELIRRLLGFPVERFYNRVAEMGNMVAVGIPAVLHQCRSERTVAAGDMVMLLGTSAGYSQAGLICRL
jgi:3-oxoacyl-[acyl-carrier-protein] synthase III